MGTSSFFSKYPGEAKIRIAYVWASANLSIVTKNKVPPFTRFISYNRKIIFGKVTLESYHLPMYRPQYRPNIGSFNVTWMIFCSFDECLSKYITKDTVEFNNIVSFVNLDPISLQEHYMLDDWTKVIIKTMVAKTRHNIGQKPVGGLLNTGIPLMPGKWNPVPICNLIPFSKASSM